MSVHHKTCTFKNAVETLWYWLFLIAHFFKNWFQSFYDVWWIKTYAVKNWRLQYIVI